MKKIFLSTLILLTLVLAACSSPSTRTSVSSRNNELPIETQLAVGTLQLEGTEQDISSEQAEELIVYWQVYKELTQSETSAQAEIDGLIAQIQETMTEDQMQAINEMEITQQDVLVSTQGMAVVSSDSSTVSASSDSVMPAGGPPSDGMAPPDDGGMPADMSSAAPASGVDSAQSAETGAGLSGTAAVPSLLIDALIQSLQQKIAA